jgi:broad specificity phosphatase PhoE
VPLSPVGRRQANLAAARLARPHASPALPVPLGPPLELVHSTLARAAETAGFVLDAGAAADPFGRRFTARPEAAFAEVGQGEWEGQLATDIAAQWADVLAAWRRQPAETHAPGGESLAEVQARVRPALGQMLESLAEGRQPGTLDRPQVLGNADPIEDRPWSILVAHDGIFKVVLLTLFGMGLDRFWTFPFALCGISVVEFRAGRATLRAHNLTEHLAPLREDRAQAASNARERSGAL